MNYSYSYFIICYAMLLKIRIKSRIRENIPSKKEKLCSIIPQLHNFYLVGAHNEAVEDSI